MSLEFTVGEKAELEGRGRDGLIALLNGRLKSAALTAKRIAGSADGQDRDLTATEAARMDELFGECDEVQTKLDSIMTDDADLPFAALPARPRKVTPSQVIVNGPYPAGMRGPDATL